jgi:chromate transporter
MDTLRLALVCLKVGTFVFGGGMSMIPLMEQDVVTRYGWLTEREFWDAVALGQMTPGPLLVSATFIGYKIGGPLTATVATFCIFLPSCLMTILIARQLTRLKDNVYVQGFLRGVTPAVVGLLLSFGVKVGRSALGPAPISPFGTVHLTFQWAHFGIEKTWGLDPVAVILAALALTALVGIKKIDAVYVIAAAGLIGWWVYR